MLLAGAIAWTAFTLSDSLPYWPVNPLLSTSPWFNFQIDLVRCLWAILPSALLWGASFPLALAAVASEKGESADDPGEFVGTTYAANTVGAIVGAIGFSVVFVPWLGSRGSERLLIALSIIAALLVLKPLVQYWRTITAVALGIAAGLGAMLAWRVHEVPGSPWPTAAACCWPPEPASRCIRARG